MAEPIEQTVKLYHDRRPEKSEKYANSNYEPQSLSLNKNQIASGPKNNTLKSTNATNKSTSKSKIGHKGSSNNIRPQTVSKFRSENNFNQLEYRQV